MFVFFLFSLLTRSEAAPASEDLQLLRSTIEQLKSEINDLKEYLQLGQELQQNWVAIPKPGQWFDWFNSNGLHRPSGHPGMSIPKPGEWDGWFNSIHETPQRNFFPGAIVSKPGIWFDWFNSRNSPRYGYQNIFARPPSWFDILSQRNSEEYDPNYFFGAIVPKPSQWLSKWFNSEERPSYQTPDSNYKYTRVGAVSKPSRGPKLTFLNSENADSLSSSTVSKPSQRPTVEPTNR